MFVFQSQVLVLGLVGPGYIEQAGLEIKDHPDSYVPVLKACVPDS